MSRDGRKLVFGASDQVRHKLAFTATGSDYVEIVDVRKRRMVLSVKRKH